ncbi:Syntaxin-16 [Trachymyrmex zeteki]|uniref:Syntaxin-16 n=1 Tax=Mycetomoellerius zeteki TaxID=64791 RepID=A0A151X3F1_9HYME|nr:PREDICTED: syntaxin-16 [Trachymyrmex zeteki]KYQ54780.1 Syntaxin-16 [Trachymyrmex zeteki]
MATRNLTEPFVLMRNNAMQSRHIYAEQNLTDIVALVESDSGESDNVELKGVDSDAPPAWADALEETQYILSRLRVKIDSLVELHSKQLTRPTLDDTSQEERQMEQLTREIGRAFSNGYRQVQTIKSAGRHEIKPAERRLANSAVMALSTALQELGLRYRTAQNHYLTQMKSREERNNQFFAEDQSLLNNIATDSWVTELNEAAGDYWPKNERRQDSVLLQLEEPEDRMKLAMEREEQIGSIVQSIADLKHIFKDLAVMVQDQGTILDRIDYNIEQTQVQVQEGYKQLKKADSYQKANKKLYCIVILAATIILLSFLFVIFKT